MSTATESKYVVSWNSFSSPLGDAKRGQKFRADSEIVKAHPEMFVDAELPQSEWPSIYGEVEKQIVERERQRIQEERKQFEEDAKANVVKLEAPVVVKCTRDHFATLKGRPATIQRGSTALATDPVVGDQPEHWKAA